MKNIFLFVFIASITWSCSDEANHAGHLSYHDFTSYSDFKETLLHLTEIANVEDRNAQLAAFFDSLEANHQIPFTWKDSVAFLYKGNTTSVEWAGDFNGWDPKAYAMKKQGDDWIFPVHLSVGKHLYKFIVDGKWMNDPANPLWEQNEYETGNSVLWVGQ